MSGTMDFFENQQRARRNTGRLVFYYVIAVILIILSVYAAVSLLIIYPFRLVAYVLGAEFETARFVSVRAFFLEPEFYDFWCPRWFIAVGSITLMTILQGTLYKRKQLASGGGALAMLLGGLPVLQNTSDPKERMLLNVVEEMAIASGVQVPGVYVLRQEKGLNAFAAGFTQDDAVIGVTRGCLEELSREELQGVIAHEFSHILYGDMRINIKLIGVLHGITGIAMIGYSMLCKRFVSDKGFARCERRADPFGLVLFLVGLGGAFCAKLIKSAVSRQREFLADAAAVQFTRNPAGLAGALRKMIEMEQGSCVESKHAQAASHLFFSSSNPPGFLGRVMSTHPPIEERIRRLEPFFAADITESVPAESVHDQPCSGLAGEPGGVKIASGEVVSSVGTLRPVHLEQAACLLQSMPAGLLCLAHELEGAEALVYALLFSPDAGVKDVQRTRLREHASVDTFFALERLAPAVETLPVKYRLPLLDVAISSLRRLSRSGYDSFKDNVRALIAADGGVSLFEYTVHKVVLRHIEPVFTNPEGSKVLYKSLRPLKRQCGLLLSCLAHHGVDDDAKRASSFTEAASMLDLTGEGLVLLPQQKCRIHDLDRALADLEHVSPLLKKQFLEACVRCVEADGWITVEQAELIRVIADALGCPVPPMVPHKRDA